jgi:transposase-like protein
MTKVFMEEKKSGHRFNEEFKVEAVRQVTERGHQEKM